ncbi:hypothetical protein ZOSMA_4G01550 [Zostera marina]|uniref:Uncharacterized protein n=1 Tax=Zostera marina TaxID=29655 RepID=A0A0K9NYI0_ZOSMR|nr:hypothetical protein ZOSMA_4G01550 [Zostera marina]
MDCLSSESVTNQIMNEYLSRNLHRQGSSSTDENQNLSEYLPRSSTTYENQNLGEYLLRLLKPQSSNTTNENQNSSEYLPRIPHRQGSSTIDENQNMRQGSSTIDGCQFLSEYLMRDLVTCRDENPHHLNVSNFIPPHHENPYVPTTPRIPHRQGSSTIDENQNMRQGSSTTDECRFLSEYLMRVLVTCRNENPHHLNVPNFIPPHHENPHVPTTPLFTATGESNMMFGNAAPLYPLHLHETGGFYIQRPIPYSSNYNQPHLNRNFQMHNNVSMPHFMPYSIPAQQVPMPSFTTSPIPPLHLALFQLLHLF